MSYLESAESQLAEIELLSSMFPTHDEFEITDQLALAELRGYIEGSTETPPPSRPQFLIKQKVDAASMKGVDFTLSCTYPSGYPNILPEITVRCTYLSRTQQSELHADLNAYLMENCQGEVCVLSAVERAKDSLHLYIDKTSSAEPASKNESSAQKPSEIFSRVWIYSHHIYNKIKRKNILEWSKELGLSGFSMPGKPGIVCVEGPQTACEEFWSRVKVLTWKKIMIRHREDIPLNNQATDSGADESMDSLRKFTGFEEAMFDPHGSRGNHMDLGQLYKFLHEKGCCDVFQIYFGIEGK
ncbi:RWD domain-containing protein 2B [Lampris incognitus]|uniref:RWD domain-containing protein 2B n=1 Tax=Lampris incognitus TaxID=2546036 RepID=UPI0024B5B9C0|nr:RWD domain-containing protein 2B [Lampris incognitus]